LRSLWRAAKKLGRVPGARSNSLPVLLRRQPTARRWPYAFRALVALLLVGHAYEDAGWWRGAAVYTALIALSLVQMLVPTLAGWVAAAIQAAKRPLDESVLFLLLGFGPTVALWFGRPARSRTRQTTHDTREQWGSVKQLTIGRATKDGRFRIRVPPLGTKEVRRNGLMHGKWSIAADPALWFTVPWDVREIPSCGATFSSHQSASV
jgi:hypothetical protein